MQLSLAPIRSAVANRTFAAYLAAAGSADTGFWIAVVAQGWLVERLTHSTLWLGLVAAAAQAPALVVSLLGGELADRLDRRGVILGANLAIAALSLLAAVLIASGRITAGLLLAIELSIGCVIALEHPVDRSFIYDLIDDGDVEEAVALSSAEFSLARTGGPALGGIAIAALGVAAGYGLNALFVLPVVAFTALALARRFGAKRERAAAGEAAGFAEAWRYLVRERTILCLCGLTAVFTVGVSPYVALLADIAENGMGLGERGYGMLQAAAGIGALAGALGLAAAGKTAHKGRIVTLAALAGGLLIALFGLLREPLAAGAALFAVGAVDTLMYALVNSYVQERVEAQYRGRANAVFTVAFLGGIPLGNVLLGAIAQRAGSQPTLLVSGLAVAACAAAFWVAVPRAREAG